MRFTALFLPLLFLVAACGVSRYPGQPGMVTNGYAKIELENLDPEGLWIYEAVYDNRLGGAGVGAIVTKLYAGAQTYTSNVRTNADGTLYIAKGGYEGGEVQMIVVPPLNQIHLNPNHKIQFLLEYDTSLNEVDDKNISEKDIFKHFAVGEQLSAVGQQMMRFRWDLLRAARLTRTGGLAYEVTALEMAKEKFTPTTPVLFETSITQNAVKLDMGAQTKAEMTQFLEAKFPKGYKGPVDIHVKGAPAPLKVTFGFHTLKTAEAAGFKIIKNASQKLADEIARKYAEAK